MSADIENLRAALLEHGLLVIRNQQLTPEQQVATSQLFGVLETFHGPASRTPLAEIFRVASRPEDGHVEVGRYWHSDGSFRFTPTAMSIWYSVAQAEDGGQTLFADQQSAYRQLDDATRARIRHLYTWHGNGVEHPQVLTHPATGRQGLYLNVGLTHGVVGLPATDGHRLIGELDAHLSRAGAVYEHAWRPGDLVIADSFRTAHRATPTLVRYRRILDRTTVQGDGAFWIIDPEKINHARRMTPA